MSCPVRTRNQFCFRLHNVNGNRPKTAAGFSAAIYWCFTRHCCWHRNFQLSACVFHGVFKFINIWFNEEDTPAIVGHYRDFVSRWSTFASLFVLMHRTYPATKCLAWRSFAFSLVSSRTMYILQVAFRSIKKILWNLSMHLIIIFLHPRSSNHQFFLQQYIQWRMCSSGNVDVLQRNRKWFYSRHVQFDTGFHVMALNEISCNGPEIIFSLRIIACWVILLWTWRGESASFFWTIPD